MVILNQNRSLKKIEEGKENEQKDGISKKIGEASNEGG